MELDPIKDTFDRVAKKQKLSSSKTQEIVNQVGKELEDAIVKIQEIKSGNDEAGCSNHGSILVELKTRLNEMAPLEQLESCQKEVNVGLSKCVKAIEKFFNPDISKAYRNVEVDTRLMDEIIASHLYREAMFDVGDSFLCEANTSEASSLKLPFQQMYEILEAMKSRNLEPALSWARQNHDRLLQNGSCLGLKLHQLQFVEILNGGSRDEALKYARAYLAPFATVHKVEVQKLITCILWAGRLDQSPYVEFLSITHWEKLADELTQQFCSLLGQSYESPLSMVVSAGAQALPTLLKLMTVMASKKQEWQTMKQLPVPIDIGKEFQFHSVFVCPVLREQVTDENPPMLLPCGHVLSKQSIVKLSKSSTRPFKCPYCPLDSTMSQCLQLHF